MTEHLSVQTLTVWKKWKSSLFYCDSATLHVFVLLLYSLAAKYISLKWMVQCWCCPAVKSSLWYIFPKPIPQFISLFHLTLSVSFLSVLPEGEQSLWAFIPVPEPSAGLTATTASPSSPTAPVWFGRPWVSGQAALLLRLRGPQLFFPQSLQMCLWAVVLTARWV